MGRTMGKNSVATMLAAQTDSSFTRSIKCEVPLSALSPTVRGEVSILRHSLNVQSEFPLAIKSENSYLANLCSVKSEETSAHSTVTSSGVTTELENFQDLTEWCRQTRKAPDMSLPIETDELNTPVIELGEFLFASPTVIDNTPDECYGLLNVTSQNGSPDFYNVGEDIQSNRFSVIESSESTDNVINMSEAYQYSNVYINDNGGGEVQENNKPIKKLACMNSYNINNIFTTTCADNVYSQQKPSVSNLQKNVTPISTNQMSQESPSEDLFTVPPVHAIVGMKSGSSSFQLGDIIQVNDSNTLSQNFNVDSSRKSLRLDFSNIWMEDKTIVPTIDTPEVINTALEMDKEDFNLINFINNENVIAEELPSSGVSLQFNDDQSQGPSTSNDPDPSYESSETSDDDDYEPPWKKSKTPRSAPKHKTKRAKSSAGSSKGDLGDSEMSNISSVIEPVRVVKRGRPPKRNVSISSESNAGSEVSRYRELRDKNNEASRRSRFNRKLKEQHLEQEAQDLDVKNRKLKVRVEELEKLVNTMRNNLMQMLLKK